jgi:hypothetical protein
VLLYAYDDNVARCCYSATTYGGHMSMSRSVATVDVAHWWSYIVASTSHNKATLMPSYMQEALRRDDAGR